MSNPDLVTLEFVVDEAAPLLDPRDLDAAMAAVLLELADADQATAEKAVKS